MPGIQKKNETQFVLESIVIHAAMRQKYDIRINLIMFIKN